MLTPYKKSLVARLLAGFLLLSLIMVVAVSLIAYSLSRQALIESVFERLKVAVTLKENELNRWISDQQQEIVFLAKSPEIRDNSGILLTRDSEHHYFREAYFQLTQNSNAFIKRNPYFREISILAADGGRVVFSTTPEHENSYWPHDLYFTEGLKGTYVQNVYPSPQTYEPTLTIATPLIDEKGERKGVLVVHFNLEWMDQLILENAGLGESGETYLVDKYNDFVSGLRFGRDEFPRGVHTEGIDRAVNGETGYGRYVNYNGQKVVGYYRWVAERELALLAEMQESEALQPARRLGVVILLVGSIVSVLLAVGIYLLARQIARPILAIADASSRIAGGELELEVPVRSEDEVGTLARSLNRMVTQLRNLYLSAADKEEKYRLLIENQTDMVVKVDLQGCFLFVNSTYLQTFGKSEDELLGKSFMPLVHPDDQMSTEREMAKLFHPPHTCFIEQRAMTVEGWRWQAWADSAVLDDNGEVIEIIGVGRDITDRKAAEIELEKYQKYLEEMVEERTSQLQAAQDELVQKERLAALGQLAATVSHEIRNPLGTIRNAVYTLDETLVGEEFAQVRKMAELAQRNIDRCDRIINEMLDFTRQRELLLEKTNFDRWLKSTLAELPMPGDVDLRLALNCEEEAWIDQELIRRVVVNIMTNAFQAFMNYEAGQKLISVTSEQVADELVVTIADNGPGISEKNLVRIFEPLFSTKGFGVGLGMAIVKNIVTDHGGRIEVQSVVGEGASVKITLPARRES